VSFFQVFSGENLKNQRWHLQGKPKGNLPPVFNEALTMTEEAQTNFAMRFSGKLGPMGIIYN
jgi:hypothetical protein